MIKLSIMTTTTAVTSISHLGNDRFCWDGWEVVGALAAGFTAAGAGLGAAGWGGADGVGVGYVGFGAAGAACTAAGPGGAFTVSTGWGGVGTARGGSACPLCGRTAICSSAVMFLGRFSARMLMQYARTSNCACVSSGWQVRVSSTILSTAVGGRMPVQQ